MTLNFIFIRQFDDMGNTVDAKLSRLSAVLIPIHLVKFNMRIKFLHLLVFRLHGLARAAPIGIKFNHLDILTFSVIGIGRDVLLRAAAVKKHYQKRC